MNIKKITILCNEKLIRCTYLSYQFISRTCFYRNIKQDWDLYFITQNIVQRYASKVKHIWDFFYMKMHRKAISLYVVTKGDWVDVSTQRGNCLPSSKTLNCICATISLLQTPRQAIKRQCRRMNEKYHKGDERTKLIDQGGSRGQRRCAFGAKRMHTCIV